MVMLKRENGVRWALLHRTEIMDMDNPSTIYLRRWRIVECPWFGLFLHSIFVDDSYRHIHNHPWGFWSLVLRGGYTEAGPHAIPVESLWVDSDDPATQLEREELRAALDRRDDTAASPIWGRTRTRRAGSLRRVRPGEFHSVLRLFGTPTWTLVAVGRHDERGWGFATPDGFVPDKKYATYLSARSVA